MIANNHFFNILHKIKKKKMFKRVIKRNYKGRDKGLDLLLCHCGCELLRNDLKEHIQTKTHLKNMASINGYFCKYVDKEEGYIYYNGFKQSLENCGIVVFD